MANTLSLYDLFTLQNNDQLTGLVEDVTTYAPEFTEIPVVRREGTFYKVVRRTAYPTVGFRKVNAGASVSKSAYKQEVKEMFFLDAPINVDEAIIKADDRSTGDVWTHEATGFMKQAMITLGTQTWYGTSADALGFQGIRSQLAGVVGAQTSPTASATTSAYLVWMDAQGGTRYDVGKNGEISLPPPYRQQVVDPADSTKVFQAWVSNISMWIGLASVSQYSNWAVVGIDSTKNAGVFTNALTDQLAAQLISNIPLARRQGLKWFMNRTSYSLLQQTRSTINVAGGYALQAADAAGKPAWAPRPTDLEMYPIVVTDCITNTETN